MEERIDSKYTSQHIGPKIKGLQPKRPAKVLREDQAYAIALKVEDKLNNSQIARMVSSKYDAISPQSVARWWGKPHVKRALKKYREEYNENLLPAIALELNEVRELGIQEIKNRITDKSSRLSEVVGATKFASEELEKHKAEIIDEEDNEQAKKQMDDLWEKATPAQRKMMAEIAAFGSTEDIPEAEVIDETPAIEPGDDKETGT